MRIFKSIFLIILLLTLPFCCGGDRIPEVIHSNDPKINEALQESQRAVMAYPTIRLYRKTIERKIYKKLPVDKSTAVILTSTVAGLSRGEIDTRVIKRMDMRLLGGRMRPNMHYNWKNDVFGAMVTINWSF